MYKLNFRSTAFGLTKLDTVACVKFRLKSFLVTSVTAGKAICIQRELIMKCGPFCLLSRLCRDERGSIFVRFTIFLIALMGMLGLALDGGRLTLLHNSLQDLADAAALAGAEELDGFQDAETRATAAAQAMANKNPPRWYDIGGSTTIDHIL